MNKIKILYFVIILFSVINLRAQDHGEPEKKAEETAVKPSLQPWIPIEAKIQELSAKIRSKQESIDKLIEEKNHLSAQSPHLKETIKNIIKEHDELKKLAEDYQKNINQLNYRFPERNAKSQRAYDRIEVKSIDEMEQALGVDGKLNRNVKKMRSQYGGAKSKTSSEHEQDDKKAKPQIIKDKSKSIEEEDSIIINK